MTSDPAAGAPGPASAASATPAPAPAPAPADGGARVGRTGSVGSRHAVVLGAGVAGLLAARVLAETFDQVTILDRDDLPDVPDVSDVADPADLPATGSRAARGAFVGVGVDGSGLGERRGVPQARHLHALMDRGRQIVEQLHPGIVEDLVAAGAQTSEVLVGGRYYMHGRRLRTAPTGLTSVLASRPLLERELRRRTAALPRVRIRPRTTVVGLIVDGTRVVGVRIRSDTTPTPTPTGRSVPPGGIRPSNGGGPSGQGQLAGMGESLAAELVVDASGRNSRSLDWLVGVGLPPPASTRVAIDLGYASRLYERRPEHLDGQRSIIVATAPGLVGAGAVAVEGGRWLVTLAGLLGAHPPADHDGFEQFAAALPVPDVYDLIREAKALGDPVPYRFRESVRRHYERQRQPPEGLIVLGDALCSFNPLYAQGMTVAAQQALVLGAALRDGPAGAPARFYTAVTPIVDVAWDMAVSSDLRYPQVAGHRDLRGRITASYAARAQRRAHHDPAVARTLMRVVNLVDPPTALLRPALAARVLAPEPRGR
ncbi:FAD-dependent oxidoreductase [Frankia sp. AgPm24]|uniref:NAD(P)/FAD-dependent oxidoreductase n=1 Tax=Frankia sp. AgPm24 TaxID=631128 RepID=UPI00200F6D73|nr:FAD-dependent oxidoreductase [Frankia sp. AgPm24]MCK9923628.1 FAD-dependent oxidoreductase [Frankia sp. AgPm24]